MKSMYQCALAILTGILFLSGVGVSFAFASTGTIIPPYQYAWDDNGGYVNWNAATASSSVVVTDTGLTGYIWSAGFGWINLAPTQGGVTNNGGVLGGWAWGQNTGWINFTGVTIDSSGIFHGHTVAQSTFGTITFDCAYCEVMSTWQAPYVAPPASQSSSSGSGGNGPPPSGPESFGYQASGTTSIQPTPKVPVVNQAVPASLMPTSPPPTTQPTTRPPKQSGYSTNAKTSTQNNQNQPLQPSGVSATTSTMTASEPTVAPIVEPATVTSTTPPPVTPVTNSPSPTNTPQSTFKAGPLTPACSWLTCWWQGIWQFIHSVL